MSDTLLNQLMQPSLSFIELVIDMFEQRLKAHGVSQDILDLAGDDMDKWIDSEDFFADIKESFE